MTLLTQTKYGINNGCKHSLIDFYLVLIKHTGLLRFLTQNGVRVYSHAVDKHNSPRVGVSFFEIKHGVL